MDSDDIFKKLSVGAVFKRVPTTKNAKKVPNNTMVQRISVSRKNEGGEGTSGISQDNMVVNEEHNITLLGNITTASDYIECKLKKRKRKDSDLAKIDAENEEINRIRNLHKINVNGKNIPPPLCNFEELFSKYKVSNRLVQNVENCGYSTPTPIQMQAIPAMLQGRQVLACAPTGSGKTAAFLIPIIHQLRKPNNNGFRALIVNPTRELSQQTFRECERLCEGTGLRVHIITKVNDSVKKFGSHTSDKFDILVTTPNRLVYLLNQDVPLLSLKSVEWLVVDESDKLFETGKRGFRDQLAVIYMACDSSNVKRAMFSATHTVEVANWCRHNLKGVVFITIGHRNTTVGSIEQQLIYVGNEEGKLIEIRNLIQNGLTPPVLVFLQSKERARDLFNELLYDGIHADIIHSDRTQQQRDNVIKAFREGKIWVLMCTELMGRGIDFKGVNLVINYDFPQTAISYIHRIGRTGRAGRPGKAITFYTQNDLPYLRSVANVMRESGCPVPEYMLNLKRPHKRIRKKLESSVPVRDDVVVKPHRYKIIKHKTKNKPFDNKK